MKKWYATWHLIFVFLVCMVLGGFAAPESAFCQPPVSQSSDGSSASDLTKGLLELLNEPKPESGSPTLKIPPADKALDRGVPEGQPSNPLESVRQSMLTAAKYLGQGSVDPQTRELQGDIVQQLDELIDQMKKSQDSSKSSSVDQQSRQDKQQSRSQSQPQSKSTSGDSKEPQEMGAAGNPSGEPGRSKPLESATVDLADPTALQKSAWGHLPERLRMQMQSRMVEQFLPSYREQIEAYFKALLEEER